jgi:hypothetical protein
MCILAKSKMAANADEKLSDKCLECAQVILCEVNYVLSHLRVILLIT